MAVLGTQKIWIRSTDSSGNESESQVIKNNGYISIQLHSVNYMSKGNFWQNVFGGNDKIALAVNIKYQSGTESIEATTIQDVREVKVNQNYNLGIQKNVAVKIPAVADALSLNIKMQALKNDILQSKFEMLNKTEYQSALQLAPTVVGQVLTVASLVKNLFTDSDQQTQLEASYAGIISATRDTSPVKSGKLVCGFLAVVSTNDGDQLPDLTSSNFELKNDVLFYKGKQLENTYALFNVLYDPLKGIDEKSNWFKKYIAALNNLDTIELTTDEAEWKKILSDSKKVWMDGNALLDDDATYIQSERTEIKKLYLYQINTVYQNKTKTVRIDPSSYADALSYILEVEGKSMVARDRQMATGLTRDTQRTDVITDELYILERDAKNYMLKLDKLRKS